MSKRSVLITGGSGTVGTQIVNHFLARGFIVITTTRNVEALAYKFDINNENLKLIEIDFVKDSSVNDIVSYLNENSLHPECIIHNARSLEYLKLEDDGSIAKENFLGELYINVVFPYELSLAIKENTKHLNNIIFISSMYGVVAPTPKLYDDFQKSSPINYGVSKAAQIHLTKELAVRLAPLIRVNCVSFGGIMGRADKGFIERYKSLNPQAKMLDKRDVIGPIDFLVSENSKDMTGQNLIVDGGWTIW